MRDKVRFLTAMVALMLSVSCAPSGAPSGSPAGGAATAVATTTPPDTAASPCNASHRALCAAGHKLAAHAISCSTAVNLRPRMS